MRLCAAIILFYFKGSLFFYRTLLLPTSSTSADTTVAGHRINSDTRSWLRHLQNQLYCNSVLAGAPRALADQLQRVLNAAARVMSDTRKYDRWLSKLFHEKLHWLDVRDRVTFKLQAWWSWSIDAWMARHLSTSPFTVSHCTARDISVPLSEIFCTYHVTDSIRTTATGLLSLLVCPPGTIFRTLSTIRTPPKMISVVY